MTAGRTAPRTPRRVVLVAALTALLAFCALLSLRVGSLTISWHDAVGAVFAYHGAAHSPAGETVVRSLRVPRTVAGLCVGAALGVTGALMQGLTRNPLADPGLLGINSGAGLAVSLAIYAGISTVGGYVWFAFAGAAIAGAAVYALGSTGSPATPVKLALAGAIVSALTGAVTSALNLLDPTAGYIARFWLAGSIAGISVAECAIVSPFLAAGLVLALASGKALNGLALGDDTARALGQRVGLTRATVALAAVLLAAPAVAIAGPIAFVGLMVPHAARFLTGPDYRWILPCSALLGPVVLLLADTIGRVVAEPAEIQAGIMTAVLGGPVFVVLARRRTWAGL